MASVSSYNRELAVLNKQLILELQRADILKSEELGTCEFISEMATIYLKVIKEHKSLPFQELEEKLIEADQIILANILIDRKNLIAARDSALIAGKKVFLDKERTAQLLEEYQKENQEVLKHVKKTFNISADTDFDAFENSLQHIIDQQVDLWGELEDQKTPANDRILELLQEKYELQIKRSQEENGEAEDTLYAAVQKGELVKTQELVRAFWGFTGGQAAFINTPNAGGELPLHLAAFYGRHEIVNYLLEKGAQAELVDGLGRQAIHWAAKGGHTHIVQTFLKRKISIDTPDQDYGRTPLHYATHNGLKEMTQFLLGMGADINAKAAKEQNTTPLHEAVMREHTSIVSDLTKSSDLEVTRVDSENHSAAYYAVKIGSSQILALLTTHPSWRLPDDKEDPNHPDKLLTLKPGDNESRIKAILEKAKYLKTRKG